MVFYGFADHSGTSIAAGDDAGHVQWFNVEALPELAFDHLEIIATALRELK